MVNNNNQNNWVPPKEWTPNIPKTATVSFFDAETGRNLTLDEWRTLNNNTGEVQIINQGQSYRSWKANAEHPSYGPGERFCSLIISCPSCSNREITGWVHAIDDGSMQISNEARIRCSYCYHTNHIKNWLFACSQHRGDFRATNQTSFTRAVLIAINNKRIDEALMTELLSYLEDHGW